MGIAQALQLEWKNGNYNGINKHVSGNTCSAIAIVRRYDPAKWYYILPEPTTAKNVDE
jgi:hypothetical protein